MSVRAGSLVDIAGLIPRLLEKLPACTSSPCSPGQLLEPCVGDLACLWACRSVSLWPGAESPAGEACWVNPAVAAHKGNMTAKRALVSGAAHKDGPEAEMPRPKCPGGQVTWRRALSVGKCIHVCSSAMVKLCSGATGFQ